MDDQPFDKGIKGATKFNRLQPVIYLKAELEQAKINTLNCLKILLG